MGLIIQFTLRTIYAKITGMFRNSYIGGQEPGIYFKKDDLVLYLRNVVRDQDNKEDQDLINDIAVEIDHWVDEEDLMDDNEMKEENDVKENLGSFEKKNNKSLFSKIKNWFG